MKNSEWYKKLWRKKLKELPVRKDADKAWSDMKQILDQQMPVNPTIGNGTDGGKSAKPFISKVVSLLGYALPAVAIVCTVTYFVAKPPQNKTNEEKEKLKDLIEHSTGNRIEKITPADSAYSISSDKQQGLPGEARPKDSYGNNIEVNNPKLFAAIQRSRIIPNNKNVSVNSKNYNYDTVSQSLSSSPYLSKTKISNTEALNNNSSYRTYTTQANASISNKPGLNIVNSTRKPVPDNEGLSKDSNRALKREASTTTEQRANHTDLISEKRPSDSKERKSASRSANRTTGLSSPDITGNNQGTSASKEDPYKQVNKNKIVNDKSVKQNKPVKAKGNSIFNRLFNAGPPFSSKKPNGLQPGYGTGFNYGVKAGYNANNIANNIYFGAYTSLDIINNHWFLSSGVIINTARTVSGSYSHPSYFRPDSIPPFSISDSRKIYVMDIPFNIGYRLSKTVSIKGGPLFSIPVKQTAIFSKVGYAPVPLDTMQHTKAINAALAQTVLKPKFNLGISAGIGVQVRRFNIEATYQQSLTPYKVSSELGSYKFNFHSLIFGIGFQLNKGR